MNIRRNALLPDEVKQLTPSQQAKAEGLKSLSQVSELTGQSLQTLSNWAKDKPELFKIVLLGCVSAVSMEGAHNGS